MLGWRLAKYWTIGSEGEVTYVYRTATSPAIPGQYRHGAVFGLHDPISFVKVTCSAPPQMSEVSENDS